MGTMLTFESGDVELNYMLSRAKFEDTCGSLILPIMEIVKESLNASGLEKDQINEIILVGGSSRIPLV